VVEVSAIALGHCGGGAARVHALEGNGLRRLVGVLALKGYLDVFEFGAFRRQRGIRTDPIQHGETRFAIVYRAAGRTARHRVVVIVRHEVFFCKNGEVKKEIEEKGRWRRTKE